MSAVILIARAIIGMISFYAEEISERMLPTYIAPWQNFFLRVILWLLVPFIIWAVVKVNDWVS